MAADIRMPHLGFEFHDWWSERVVDRDLNVDVIQATLIWSSRWPWKRASEVCDIVLTTDWLGLDLGMCIGVYVGDFFPDAPGAVARHSECVSLIECVFVDTAVVEISCSIYFDASQIATHDRAELSWGTTRSKGTLDSG